MHIQAAVTTLLLFSFLVAIATTAVSEETEDPLVIEKLTEPSYLTHVMEESPDSIVVVDVRTEAEYRSDHIPGAVNIPFDTIHIDIPTEQKDAPIVVYCRSGNRSSRAAETLRRMGYSNIVDFGGIGSWPGDLAR